MSPYRPELPWASSPVVWTRVSLPTLVTQRRYTRPLHRAVLLLVRLWKLHWASVHDRISGRRILRLFSSITPPLLAFSTPQGGNAVTGVVIDRHLQR